MASFWHTVLDLLRLKAGPQDMPSHRAFTLVSIVVYVAVVMVTSAWLARVLTTPGEEPVDESTRNLISIAIHFGAAALLLAWRRRPERLQQTLLAFAATGTVVRLLVFFLLLQQSPDGNQPILALVWFALFGWSLAVDANIFRHALDVAMPVAMLITVMLLALTYIVLHLAML